MEKLFKLKERGANVRTEIVAGVTTFLAMAYILAVNPGILSVAGMDFGAVFTATALSAAIATLVMAFVANLPFALAPGMGLNAFLAYTVVIGMGHTWQFALTAVFVEGIIFIILTIFNIREAIVNSIPANLRKQSLSVSVSLLHLSVFRMLTLSLAILQHSLNLQILQLQVQLSLLSLALLLPSF